MKKLERLIEIKRQMLLANERARKITKKLIELQKERAKLVGSFTVDERRLYKSRIERACKL